MLLQVHREPLPAQAATVQAEAREGGPLRAWKPHPALQGAAWRAAACMAAHPELPQAWLGGFWGAGGLG